jgi:hypothetical protein
MTYGKCTAQFCFHYPHLLARVALPLESTFAKEGVLRRKALKNENLK